MGPLFRDGGVVHHPQPDPPQAVEVQAGHELKRTAAPTPSPPASAKKCWYTTKSDGFFLVFIAVS